jgi:hypothetical protein
LRRGETVPLRIEPAAGKSLEHGSKSSAHKPRDILKEHERRSALGDDALDLRPEPAVVVGAEPFASGTERLARESRSDEIHLPTPWLAVEGGEIRPHRSGIQRTRLALLDQMLDAKCFPLHVTDRSQVWNCDLESEADPSDPGT